MRDGSECQPNGKAAPSKLGTHPVDVDLDFCLSMFAAAAEVLKTSIEHCSQIRGCQKLMRATGSI